MKGILKISLSGLGLAHLRHLEPFVVTNKAHMSSMKTQRSSINQGLAHTELAGWCRKEATKGGGESARCTVAQMTRAKADRAERQLQSQTRTDEETHRLEIKQKHHKQTEQLPPTDLKKRHNHDLLSLSGGACNNAMDKLNIFISKGLIENHKAQGPKTRTKGLIDKRV